MEAKDGLNDALTVKNKIKRVDRLMGNEALHRDIPMIFRNITSMLKRQLSLCVIAVDWSGYPSQVYHVLTCQPSVRRAFYSFIEHGCSF